MLEKLGERITYAEMAAELHVSLNTVKTHLRRAYMKAEDAHTCCPRKSR